MAQLLRSHTNDKKLDTIHQIKDWIKGDFPIQLFMNRGQGTYTDVQYHEHGLVLYIGSRPKYLLEISEL